MIGSGLKKLAKENGMQVANGVAYGNFQGYAVTFSEGSGYKRVDFATRFPDAVAKTAFLDAVNAEGIQRNFRVRNMCVDGGRIQIYFTDNPGTMKKIREFLAWFLPLLRQYGTAPVSICTHCGGDVTGGRWILLDGTAYFLHDSCAKNLAAQIDAGNARRKEEDTGSYVSGTLGALLGAAIGAVLWAVILIAGYVASIAGLAIGFLSQKGYDLLKGRQGKGKVAILIVATIIGVALGTLGGYIGAYLVEFGGEFGFGEIVYAAVGDLLGDPSAIFGDLVMGLLFAALGVYALLRNTGKAVADDKLVYLP